jgi:hypothetical protein
MKAIAFNVVLLELTPLYTGTGKLSRKLDATNFSNAKYRKNVTTDQHIKASVFLVFE